MCVVGLVHGTVDVQYEKYKEMRERMQQLQRSSERGDLGARMEMARLLKQVEFGMLHGEFAARHAVEHHPARQIQPPIRRVPPHPIRHVPVRHVPHPVRRK